MRPTQKLKHFLQYVVLSHTSQQAARLPAFLARLPTAFSLSLSIKHTRWCTSKDL